MALAAAWRTRREAGQGAPSLHGRLARRACHGLPGARALPGRCGGARVGRRAGDDGVISEESDIEINEIHHNMKRDIPSGTALTLADSVTNLVKSNQQL